MLISLAYYNSSVQTVILQQYLHSLSEKLNTKILVEKIEVSFFNELTIHNLYVEDLQNDTLAYIKELKVDIDEFSIKRQTLIADKISLNEAYFKLQKYKEDTVVNLRFIINYFSSNDSLTKSNWKIEVNEVDINNSKFFFNDEYYKEKLAGVDYHHIDVTNFNLLISDIELLSDGIACQIDALKLNEKSGVQVDNLIARATVNSKGIVTQQLQILTPNSKVYGNVSFLTDSYSDLADFIDKVKIEANFDSSLVSFKDICYYAPVLDCLNKSLILTGKVKGRINNLKGRELDIVLDDGSIFKGNADILGIPYTEDMFMHINVKELVTTKQKIEQIPMYPFVKETFVKLPSNFKHLGEIRFKGNFTGFYHDFVTYGKFKTAQGNITTDVEVDIDNGNVSYKGKVKTDRFNLGGFFEMPDQLGEVTMDVNVDGEGFTKKELKATLIGEINQVVIKGYDYKNVTVKGDFEDQKFNGYLSVEDDNISFDFDGFINLTEELPKFNFTSNIQNAKLAKLNLIKSEEKLKTRFTTTLKVDVVGDDIDNMAGHIMFLDSDYKDNLDSIHIENTSINFGVIDDEKMLTIKSDVLDAQVKGKYQFKEIIQMANDFLAEYLPSTSREKEPNKTDTKSNFEFKGEIKNGDLLTKVWLKDIRLAPKTSFSGIYNSLDHSLSLNGNAPYIDFYRFHIDNYSVNSKTIDSTFYFDMNAAKIYVNDSLLIDGFNVSTETRKDSLQVNINWKKQDTLEGIEANINVNTVFNGYKTSRSKFFDSHIYIGNTLWEINSDNFIQRDSSSFVFSNLNFKSNQQNLLIDGILSDDPLNQLDITLNSFDLIPFKRIIPKSIIDLDGIVDGVASFRYDQQALIFASDLKFDELQINQNYIGKGSLKTIWNNEGKFLFVDGKFSKGHIPSISFKGNYYPTIKEETIDLSLTLNRTNLNLLSTYTDAYLKDLKGRVDGKINISGTISKPELKGYIKLKEATFLVSYLNTRYSTPICKINIDPGMISFDQVLFLDEKLNKAYANATVYHEWFSNWNTDIGLDVKNFLALNTTEKDNDLYYGKAFVTGLINIGGYKNQTYIDIATKTEKGSLINIPLSDDEEIEENNFVQFISKDTSFVKIEHQEEIDLSNIQMNFDLEVTPDAEVRIIFDEQIGDVMRSKGTGNLNFQITPRGDFNIYGEYEVDEGDYLFTLQNVINKKFTVEKGSKISWNGDPYGAQLDLVAVYRLRAKLIDLLAGFNVDTLEIYNKRIPVDLKLKMSKNMLNPDILFDITLPTADEDTRDKVKSVLYVSTKEENIQELNRQAFALLVLNRFLTPVGSDNTNSLTGVGAASSSELISNQLSNWLSKISTNFDVGLNYLPGDNITSSELELGLSAQVFNNRLTIDKNFLFSNEGNTSLEESQQDVNSLIGEFAVEYKITPDGKIRIKAFNTSNEYSLERNNALYTQGVGLFYRKEFNKLTLFKKKKKEGEENNDI